MTWLSILMKMAAMYVLQFSLWSSLTFFYASLLLAPFWRKLACIHAFKSTWLCRRSNSRYFPMCQFKTYCFHVCLADITLSISDKRSSISADVKSNDSPRRTTDDSSQFNINHVTVHAPHLRMDASEPQPQPEHLHPAYVVRALFSQAYLRYRINRLTTTILCVLFFQFLQLMHPLSHLMMFYSNLLQSATWIWRSLIM